MLGGYWTVFPMVTYEKCALVFLPQNPRPVAPAWHGNGADPWPPQARVLRREMRLGSEAGPVAAAGPGAEYERALFVCDHREDGPISPKLYASASQTRAA